MFTLRSRDKTLALDIPKVMGILNCNPDSFYAPSRSTEEDVISQMIDRMINDGADIIDIGGMSTQPGSMLIDANEEIRRIAFAISYCKKQHPDVWISVDTVQSNVAVFAIENGADIINDISGGFMDPGILKVVGANQLPYVCMHMKGTPENMQLDPQYQDLIADIFAFFTERIEACHSAGISQLIIDPGFGFGKTIDHNYQLLDQLQNFQSLQKPLLVGVSRKSMIYKFLGIKPEQALNGTSVLNAVALIKGTSIVRVHDVKEAVETIRLIQKIREA